MPYETNPEYQRILKIRKEAREKEEIYYFTGKICKRGHVANRYTISGQCVECVARPEFRERIRFQNRKITPEHYKDLIKFQENKCAICKKPLENGQQQAIDHCHKTNKIRGVLCKHCNMGLGNFRDNINALKNAATYLEKHET